MPNVLDAVLQKLVADPLLMSLVDSNIFLMKHVEECVKLCKNSEHHTVISVQAKEWSINPIITVDIRATGNQSLQDMMDVADLVITNLLAMGTESVEGTTIYCYFTQPKGEPTWDKTIGGYRIILETKCKQSRLPIPVALSFSENPIDVNLNCLLVVTPDYWEDKNVVYRYSINGTGTGGVECFITDWIRVPAFLFMTQGYAAGTYTVKVYVKDLELPDATITERSETLVIVSPIPTITLFTNHPATPQARLTTIRLICQPSNYDEQSFYFRFWVKGPGTANVWLSLGNWSKINYTVWTPQALDVGTNYIKAQMTSGESLKRSIVDAETAELTFVVT